MNNEDKKIPESIEVIQGDGKNLNISPVYDHIKDTEPKPSSKKPKNIIIPKKEIQKKYIIWGTNYGSNDSVFVVPGENEATTVLKQLHYY